MPGYEVRTPDGTSYTVDSPTELSDDQLTAVAQHVLAQHTPDQTVLPQGVADLAKAHPYAAEATALGLRVAGPTVGAALGTLASPGFGTVAGGAGGAAIANPFAQELELAAGLRQKRSVGSFAGDVALGAIPAAGIGRDLGLGGSLAVKAAEGAGLGVAQQQIEKGVDERRRLTLGEAGAAAGVGAATAPALELGGRAVRAGIGYLRGAKAPEVAAPIVEAKAPTPAPAAPIGETPTPEAAPIGETSVPPPPATPVLRYADVVGMTPDQLAAAADRAKVYERGAAADVFGPEAAARYERLQRTANGSSDRADAAFAEIQKMEAGLTEAQQARLFGIGEEGYNAEELARYAHAAEDYAPTNVADRPDDHLRNTVGRELLERNPATDPESAIRLNGALDELGRRGFGIDEIMSSVADRAAGSGYSSEDAATMLRARLTELQAARTSPPSAASLPAPESPSHPETAPETTPAGFSVAPDTAPIASTPMPPERIPAIAEKLGRSPEEVAQLGDILQKIAPEVEAQSRATVPDAEVERFAAALTPPQEIKPGQALNVEEYRALKNATQASFDHVDTIRAAAKNDPALAPQLDQAETDNLRLLRLISGARSEPGRTLRSMRTDLAGGGGDAVTAGIQTEKAIRGLAEAGALRKGVDPDALTKRVIASVGDPVSALAMVRDATRVPTADRLRNAVYFNYLSRPVTRVRKFLGDSEALLEATLGKAAAVGVGEPSVRPGELGAPLVQGTVTGMLRGARKGFEILKDGLTREDLQDPDLLFRFLSGESPNELAGSMRGISLPGDTGLARTGRAIAGVGHRSIEAINTFFDTTSREIALHQRAYADGDAAAKAEGLTGKALSARRRELAAQTIANPSEAVQKEVVLAGQRATYQQRPGEFPAQWISKLDQTNRYGRLVKLIFVPFVKTPANILRRGIQKVPIIGSISASNEVGRQAAAMKLDPVAVARLRSQLVGETALGYAAITPLILLAAHGFIQGEPSTNGPARARFYEQGGKPNSITLGGRNVPLGMLSGPGLIAQAVASAVKLYQNDGNDAAFADRLLAASEQAAKSVRDVSFMNGIGQIFDSSTGEVGSPGKVIGRIAAGVLIPGAAQDLSRVLDPTVRNPTGGIGQQIVGQVAARTPGLSQTVPPRVGTFGEVRQESLGSTPGQRAFSVATGTNVPLPDPMRAELDRLEQSVGHSVGPAPPAARVKFTFKDLGQTATLTGPALLWYQRQLGEAHAKAVSTVLGRSDYGRLTDPVRADELHRMLRQATADVKIRTEDQLRRSLR